MYGEDWQFVQQMQKLLLDLAKQTSQDYGELLANPGITLRSLFISDPYGFVIWVPVAHSNEKKKVFRLVETHGEVCPATGRHSPLWPKQVQLLPEPFQDLCVPEACQVTGESQQETF